MTRRCLVAHVARMHPDGPWSAVRVAVAPAAADAVANFLVEGGASGVIVHEDRSDTVLEGHVPRRAATALAAALRDYLGELGRLDPTWSAGAVEVVPVPAVDWEGVFRAHHTPLAIGERLLVAPPWDVPQAPGREVLVIEPGMAFGTGQHVTTRTCLEELEMLVASGRVASALDVGTGSGLLAAALVRLGVPRVVAIDVDPAVLGLARSNLDRNAAAAALLCGGTVAAIRGSFDLVVANLLADILDAEAAALAARVAPGGSIVVSGLLAEQVGQVLAAFPGWHLVAVRGDDTWRTLRLERAAR